MSFFLSLLVHHLLLQEPSFRRFSKWLEDPISQIPRRLLKLVKRNIYKKLHSHSCIRFSVLLKQAPPNSCVCLVFDSNGLAGYKGPQYETPSAESPSLSGLNSYPIMMSIPQVFNHYIYLQNLLIAKTCTFSTWFVLQDYEFLSHKANIVSMIMNQRSASNTINIISTQLDTKLNCTYHLAQVRGRLEEWTQFDSLLFRSKSVWQWWQLWPLYVVKGMKCW